MSNESLLSLVAEALAAVGVHRAVPMDVTRVEVEGKHVWIWLTLHYRRAMPVCCGEPGCYIPFLGVKRGLVAHALSRKLGFSEEPLVSISVRMAHEAGYEHLNLATGEPAGAGIDCTLEYEPTHFQQRARSSR